MSPEDAGASPKRRKLSRNGREDLEPGELGEAPAGTDAATAARRQSTEIAPDSPYHKSKSRYSPPPASASSSATSSSYRSLLYRSPHRDARDSRDSPPPYDRPTSPAAPAVTSPPTARSPIPAASTTSSSNHVSPPAPSPPHSPSSSTKDSRIFPRPDYESRDRYDNRDVRER